MNVNNPKISVIMPSLNVVQYISQCLESVVNQTLVDIEIICVDAGSDDGTLEILNDYSMNDSRILLLNSDKKSYGYQVNLGLSKAKGEYVAIVETDDFIENNMFKSLYDLSENGAVDIIKGSFFHFNDSDKSNIFSKKDDVKKSIKQNKIFTLETEPKFLDGHPSIWAGIYRHKFLIDNNIKMLEVSGGGWVDNTFFYETAIQAKSIKYIHEAFYSYRISNPNSSSNKFVDFTIPMKRILDIFEIIKKFDVKSEEIIVIFYNRLFRYIEIILENNNDSDKNLDYDTCYYIHEVVKKIDEDILVRRLKFNFQKLYYKYISQSFMKKFDKKMSISENINLKNKSVDINKNYKVSVIMPVFNGEKFIQRSVESIIKQTLNDIEIVFINDGSTDNSLDILNQYAKKCKFVKILNQSNQGSGKARNYGIREANGDYIAFLDVDDFFMDYDALEKMYDIAFKENANMVSANIKHDLETPGNYKPFGPFHYYKSNDIILPEAYGIPWSFYKNIFKKEFLISNNIFFPDLLRGQDPVFLAKALTKVDKIHVVATDLYAYVYNSDTAKANNYRKLRDQLLHYKQVIDYFKDSRFSRRQHEYIHKIFLFISRLAIESINDAFNAIEEVFCDDIQLQHRLKNQLYLTFKDDINNRSLLCPNPKVSVILPIDTYDENSYKSIKSILNQSLSDIELLILNVGLNENDYGEINKLSKSQSSIRLLDYDSKNSINMFAAYNYGLNESKGDYIYFLDTNTLLNNNSLEKLFISAIINGSDIVLCDLPEGTTNNNPEIKFKELFSTVNCDYYSFDYNEIKNHIFNSSQDLSFKFYKKEFLFSNSVFFEDLFDYVSVFNIKSLLANSKLSVVHEFLFEYINQNYHPAFDLISTQVNDDVFGIFEVCDNVEDFLKENDLYSQFKTNFDIYKINQITKYLSSVRFVGSYSYNSNNIDNFDENYKTLNCAEYYGSKSDKLGLDYTFADKYFNMAREEFLNLNYRDMDFIELRNNNLSITKNIDMYQAVLKSSFYEEYCNIVSYSKINKLITDDEVYLEEYCDLKSKNIEQYNGDYSKFAIDGNKILNYGNVYSEELIPLTYMNNQLTKKYWENRAYYDYIKGSRSWKKTKPLRDFRNSFRG